MSHILLIEPDEQLSKHFQETLTARKHQVVALKNTYELEGKKSYPKCELLLIDYDHQPQKVQDLLTYYSECYFDTKILVTSRDTQLQTRLDCLIKGADDFLKKPFSSWECLLKIEKLLMYQKLKQQPFVQVRDLKLYPKTGQIEVGDKKKTLRRKETQILGCLLRYKNAVVTREMLIDTVWSGDQDIPTYSTIDVYLRRLRILLGHHGQLIKTVRGFGYMITES